MIPQHVARQKCWDNGVYVIIVPTEKGYIREGHPVTLHLERSGRIVKKGEMIFKQNSTELSDKIDEIYLSEYNRMM